MEFQCTVLEIEDEDVMTIDIKGVPLTGFVNSGISLSPGDECRIEVEFFDISSMKESAMMERSIHRKGKSLHQIILGVMDARKCIIHSLLDFEIEKEFFFDNPQLNGKYVEVDVDRIDFLIL